MEWREEMDEIYTYCVHCIGLGREKARKEAPNMAMKYVVVDAKVRGMKGRGGTVRARRLLGGYPLLRVFGPQNCTKGLSKSE